MASEFENMRAWYVVQTYSGMEYAAKRNLDRRIVSMNMENYIFQVLIPEEKRYEKKKNGELKEIVERIYPGYLFVDMIVTDDSWWVVRNTPMVSGFLGSSGGGAKPVPLPNDEIIPILQQCGLKLEIEVDFKVGDVVKVISGTFAGQDATVESFDVEKQIVLNNYSGEEKNFVFVIKGYDNENLDMVFLSGKIVNSFVYPSVTVTIPAKVYKWTNKQVLIWEGFNNMKPIGAKTMFFK